MWQERRMATKSSLLDRHVLACRRRACGRLFARSEDAPRRRCYFCKACEANLCGTVELPSTMRNTRGRLAAAPVASPAASSAFLHVCARWGVIGWRPARPGGAALLCPPVPVSDTPIQNSEPAVQTPNLVRTQHSCTYHFRTLAICTPLSRTART